MRKSTEKKDATTPPRVPKPTVHLSSIRFSDGRSYSLGSHDKVVLVGPNNSGKSLALRELSTHITRQKNQHPVFKCVTEVSFHKTGNSSSLRDYLDENAAFSNDQYVLDTHQIARGLLIWFDLDTMGPIGEMFMRHVSTENRLEASKDVDSISPNERNTRAQHQMYDNDKLSEHISGTFRSAFRESLVIDYRGGKKIPIHVGELPKRKATEERISDSYVSKVRALPRLEDQGDGMRSYAGILFEAVVLHHDMVLVDEPEAFLHPPQMRKIARTLAKEVTGQLFVSTHSSDILRGFMDSSSTDVRVIRLQRSGDINVTRETSPAQIRELWENPDLKYSNALDAIFHEQCILCEDDSDCRLYNALLDGMEEYPLNGKFADTIFVPCGGKHSMAKLAVALTSLGVPTRMVVDIDALSEKATLQAMVESVGGTWALLDRDWRVLDSDVRKGIPALTPDEIKAKIQDILAAADPGALPRSDIQTALKQDKPWALVKQGGKAMLPKGAAREAYDRLEKRLSALGIFVVPVGEIEGFAPSLGLHGPAFVSKLLQSTPIDSEVLNEAREFVRLVCATAE